MQTKQSARSVYFFDFLTIAATFIAAMIAAWFPLTGTPGPEAAQILVAVAGPTLLLSAAARGSFRHDRGFSGDLQTQALVAVTAVLVFLLVNLISSWTHDSCAPSRGYLPFLVLTAPVLVLDIAIGLWIGRIIGNARAALVMAFLFMGTYGGVVAIQMYITPSFRLLTHLFVLVDGDLLRGNAVNAGEIAFRAATLLYGLALSIAGVARFTKARSGGLSGTPSRGPSQLFLAFVLFLCAFSVDHYSTDHISSPRSSLTSTYSLKKQRGPLTVHANPNHLTSRQVDMVLAEGHLWVERLRKRLNVDGSKPVDIWLHRDREELARYTGARHVHFALPYKREIHISGLQVPHPSLGHELAHILAGELSDTLLHVPSRLGILTNSGITEGVAMAVTQELETRNSLTLRQQAAAMVQAEMASDLRGIFAEYASFFRFWGEPPGRPYIGAGAFVQAILAEKGIEAVQAIYREGSINAAFDSSEAAQAFLERHINDLQRLPLPADAIPSVTVSYARPSVLNETCDPEAQEVSRSVLAEARDNNFSKAEELAKQHEQPLTGQTLLSLARVAASLESHKTTLTYLREAAATQDNPDPLTLNHRLSRAGDAAWAARSYREAMAFWNRARVELFSPAMQREMQAKRFLGQHILSKGNQRTDLAQAAMNLVLRPLGQTDKTMEIAHLAYMLGRVQKGASPSPDIIAFCRYLLGRQYIQRGDSDKGLNQLLLILEGSGKLQPIFHEQLLRGLAIGHAKRGDYATAARGFTLVAEQTKRAVVRMKMRDRVNRVERMGTSLEAGQTDPSAGDVYLLGISQTGEF